jgi:hypothetical protein
LEIIDCFLFNTTIVSGISNEKTIFVNLFEIEQKKFQLIYEGRETEIQKDRMPMFALKIFKPFN